MEDAGVYKCRVDYKREQTTFQGVNLTVVELSSKSVIHQEGGKGWKMGWRLNRVKNIVWSAELKEEILLPRLPGGKEKIYWMKLFTGEYDL